MVRGAGAAVDAEHLIGVLLHTRSGPGTLTLAGSSWYRSPPLARNSSAFSAMPCCAYSRTSCVIFIEQNLGPHMLQKWAVLAAGAGRVSSW